MERLHKVASATMFNVEGPCPLCFALMGYRQEHFEWHVSEASTEEALKKVLLAFGRLEES